MDKAVLVSKVERPVYLFTKFCLILEGVCDFFTKLVLVRQRW